MTLPLRKRHRRMFLVLGIALPLAVIVSVAARRHVPVVDQLPAAFTIPPLDNVAPIQHP